MMDSAIFGEYFLILGERNSALLPHARLKISSVMMSR